MEIADIADAITNKFGILSEKVFNIIKETYDPNIISVNGISLEDGDLAVGWDWLCRGCRDSDFTYIPAEWLKDGFDYKAAYTELTKND